MFTFSLLSAVAFATSNNFWCYKAVHMEAGEVGPDDYLMANSYCVPGSVTKCRVGQPNKHLKHVNNAQTCPTGRCCSGQCDYCEEPSPASQAPKTCYAGVSGDLRKVQVCENGATLPNSNTVADSCHYWFNGLDDYPAAMLMHSSCQYEGRCCGGQCGTCPPANPEAEQKFCYRSTPSVMYNDNSGVAVEGELQLVSKCDNSDPNSENCFAHDFDFLDGYGFGMLEDSICESGKCCNGVCGACPEERETQCSAAVGETLDALAAHNVQCDAGEVLTSWKLVSDGCTGGEMKIAFTCKAMTYTSMQAHSEETEMGPAGGQGLDALQLQDVKCDASQNEYLTGFQMVQAFEPAMNQIYPYLATMYKTVYNCAKFEGTGAAHTTEFTACGDVQGEDFDKLANFPIVCSDPTWALNGYYLVDGTCSNGQKQFQLHCTVVLV